MWASKTVLESPSEYKKRHAAQSEKESGPKITEPVKPSIWRRLWPF